MNIQKVSIKKFNILEDFEAALNGNHILLLGDNAVGKSTLLRFIQIALGDQNHIPPNAQGEGEIITNKNGEEFKFHLKFKDGKPVVTVTSPQGLKDSRKGAIAAIVGALDFDIDEFVEMSKSEKGRKQQIEIVTGFLPDDVKQELAKFEAHVKSSYDERTDLNKLIKEKDAAIKLNPVYNLVGQKFEQVNIDEVYTQLKATQTNNENIIKVESGIAEKGEKLAETDFKINSLLAEIEGLKLVKENTQTDINKGVEWLNTHHKQDISEFEETIKNATQKNKMYDESIKLAKDVELLKTMKMESGELTAKIDSTKEAIANTIRDMESPIDGLMFDDETLLYNGVPVNPDTLSTSEIMELGIRLKMAENPDLGILFIERGESLGTDRLKVIKEIADKAGWQIIMEQVERGTKKLHLEIMAD